MLRQIFTLVVASGLGLAPAAYAQAPAPSASGGGDVCAIRPDLCDDSKPAPAKPKRRRSPASEVKSAANQALHSKPGGKCRMPGAYPLDQANLPVCKAKHAKATPAKKVASNPIHHANDIWDDQPATAPGRNPASAAPTSMSYDAYMSANAANPALSGKIADHQSAFADTSKAAVISFPGEGTSIHEDSPPSTAAAATAPVTAGAGTNPAANSPVR